MINHLNNIANMSPLIFIWNISYKMYFLLQIDADLAPMNAASLLTQRIDIEKPGDGQHYCLHCSWVNLLKLIFLLYQLSLTFNMTYKCAFKYRGVMLAALLNDLWKCFVSVFTLWTKLRWQCTSRPRCTVSAWRSYGSRHTVRTRLTGRLVWATSTCPLRGSLGSSLLMIKSEMNASSKKKIWKKTHK